MKLYEVNEAIQAVCLLLDPDPETGEVVATEEVMDQLHQLELERASILEYLAKQTLNLRAEAEALKTEELRLKGRRQILERREHRLMQILDRECDGQKTDCGVATVNYRKTSRVEVGDSDGAVAWLRENGFDTCYRQAAPEVSKSEVKRLLQDGVDVPGVALVQELSCSLR